MIRPNFMGRSVLVMLMASCLLGGCKQEQAELSSEGNVKSECFHAFEMALRERRVEDMKRALSAESRAAWEEEFAREDASIRNWEVFLESRRSSLATLFVDKVVINGDRATVYNTIGARFECRKEGDVWKRFIPAHHVPGMPPALRARRECFDPFFLSIEQPDLLGLKAGMTGDSLASWEKEFQKEDALVKSWEDLLKRLHERLPDSSAITEKMGKKEVKFILGTGATYICRWDRESWRMEVPLTILSSYPPPPSVEKTPETLPVTP